jgi:PAS domain S-box-containing protein
MDTLGEGGITLLLVGVPESVQETLRETLLPHVPDLELVAVSSGRLPESFESFHAVLIGAPPTAGGPRRGAVDLFPDPPLLVLPARSPADSTFAAIHVDPMDGKQLVETVRAALERSVLAERLEAADVALRRSDERTRLLSHAKGEIAWDWDLRTGRVSRGGAYHQIFGYAPDEIASDLEWWKEHIHPDDRVSVLTTFDAAVVGDEREIVVLYRVRRRDGSYALMVDRGFVMLDQAQRPDRIVGFAREIGLPAPGEPRPPREAALARLSALEILTDFSLAHMPLELLLTELLNRLRAAVGGDAAMAHLLTYDRESLYCHTSVGIEGSGPMPLWVPFGQGIVGRIAETGREIITKDLRGAGAVAQELRQGFASLIGVPIMLDQKVVGVLSVATREPREFRPQDQQLLELVADRLAPTFDRAKLIENVRLERERLEALSRRLVSLQEEERGRVARELHDEIGQLLTSLRMALQSGPSARQSVDEIVQDLFNRVRDISMSLRPPMLDDLGLASALQWHCERFTAQTGVRVDLSFSDRGRRFSPEIELAVFRIVQEALTNVARYAQVHEAHVAVRVVSGRLEVHVMDLGVGFEAQAASPGRSSGLTGMRERASLVNGRMSIHSEPGGGTRLLVRIPIIAETANRGEP